MSRICFAVAALCAVASTAAMAQTHESPGQKVFYTPRDGGVAAAFLVASAGLSIFDARIAHFFEDSSLLHVRAGRKLDDVFTHLNETTLTAGGLAVYAIARIARLDALEDIGLHTAASVFAASITAQVVRGPLGRSRPRNAAPAYGDQYEFHFLKGFTRFENRAFPSIHSSSGFAAASAIVAEVRRRNPGATWYVGVPAYALALTPGLARMYLGQHWASDIFAGAFLGTFYGWRVVNYSHEHATTRIDRLFLGNGSHARVRAEGARFTVGWSVRF